MLLDFGSARQALDRKSKSVTAIASAGYSPPEQYESGGGQGAWTDVYALSALCYHAVNRVWFAVALDGQIVCAMCSQPEMET